ncbi:MAG: hypothetical protein OXI15_16445 [Chromatiales bacterium]|nr:hypothetical protein [Chromatiales bacterium]
MAGVLLLARAPQRFLLHAYVSALRIPGVDIATPPIDQKRIEGRLFDMLSDALRFLDFHLMRRHRIRGLEPEVVLEFPVASLPARDPGQRDRAPGLHDRRPDPVAGLRRPGGGASAGWAAELRPAGPVAGGVYVLRNPTVYNLLLKRGLVTDAGSGIPRMIRLLREKTGLAPDLRVEGNEFVVVLIRKSSESV